jgi:LmbE family N-acetylglucosaminyl deacetylase
MPLSPEALDIGAQTRLLVVAPHPDDETIATGELIQHVRAAGGEVRVLLLTNGDDNPWPQRWLERRVWIGDRDRERWGRRRRVEVAGALEILGLGSDRLHMLGWPDMGITDRVRIHHEATLEILIAELRGYRPNLVALPALEDRHPDHGGAHVLLRLALARAGGPPPRVLSYLIHGRPEPSSLPIQLSPAPSLHAAKLAALEAHRTQMALSATRMRRATDRPERYTAMSSAPRHEGMLPWQPVAALRPWLQLLVVDGEQVRSWPWLRAPLQRGQDGRYRVFADLYGNGPSFARLSLDVSSPWIFDRWGWCEL